MSEPFFDFCFPSFDVVFSVFTLMHILTLITVPSSSPLHFLAVLSYSVSRCLRLFICLYSILTLLERFRPC